MIKIMIKTSTPIPMYMIVLSIVLVVVGVGTGEEPPKTRLIGNQVSVGAVVVGTVVVGTGVVDFGVGVDVISFDTGAAGFTYAEAGISETSDFTPFAMSIAAFCNAMA